TAVAAPAGAAFAEARERLIAARAVVAQVDPAIDREIAALFSRLYIGAPNPDPVARRFGSVTSFMVWGASLANIERHPTVFRMVEFLVHEVTHALLFGLAASQKLVLN